MIRGFSQQDCAKLFAVRLNSIVSLIIILLVAVAAGFAILRSESGGIGGGFHLLSTGGRGADSALSRLSAEGRQMLTRLVRRHSLGQQELSPDERSKLLEILADDTRAPEERLSLLYWRLLGRGEVAQELVLRVLDAGNEMTNHKAEWDFVRARICMLYAHPLAGGRSLEAFIPRAVRYAQSASQSAPDSGVFRLYELGLRWVAAYRSGGASTPESVRSSVPRLELDDLGEMMQHFSIATDWRLSLPPPWLEPFDSFGTVPMLLREHGESDYPWEKMNPYSLLIAQQFREQAVKEAMRGEPSSLIALLRLQLAQVRLDPPSNYTFAPGVAGVGILLQEMQRRFPPQGWKRLQSSAEEFRRLRDELSDTGAIVEANPELLRGGAAKDPRLLFQRIYTYYRDPLSAAVSRIIEELEAEKPEKTAKTTETSE